MMSAGDYRELADRFYAERKEYSRTTELHRLLTELSMVLHRLGGIVAEQERQEIAAAAPRRGSKRER